MPLAAVAAAARRLDLAGRKVLVAVSGGVDSTVLAVALAECAPALSLELFVGHVHHGLRPEADGEQEAVLALAARLGRPGLARRVAPGPLREGVSSRRRPTLQEAARRVRYAALYEMAAGCGAERIATAHTLDDQAETVLMRLLRGAGPDGLAGIPERSADGRVVRPLLGVARAEVERFARERRLSWVEDPSNRDPRRPRGQLRRPAWTELASALNPRWLRAIGDLAEAQRRDAEWIEAAVAAAAGELFTREGAGLRIALEGWAGRPEALGRRLVREAWRELGGARDISRPHLLRALAFLRDARPGRRLELPGGLVLRRRRADAWLGPQSDPAAGC